MRVLSKSAGRARRLASDGAAEPLDFICYLMPGWEPLIRPAEATRPWMDATPEAFAYRCLPLDIANAHGWEILARSDVVAYWTGGGRVEDVIIRTGKGPGAAVSLFGQGILTFHVEALFRTPPGWDLWVGGSPNAPKPGIAPLSGVVEADWSPYTFTMNWKFTRRNHWVSFAKGEPICFVFPVQRDALERMRPKFARLAEDSDLAEQFRAWSRSRDAFHASMADGCPRSPAEKWQKRYYRGVTIRDDTPVPGHRAKLRPRPFTHDAPAAPAPPPDDDEAWLARLLGDVARIARGGHGADAIARALTAAGLPAAMAGRLADAVMRSVAAEPGMSARPDHA